MARTRSELPTGTVTFMLTDIERSSRLWELDRVGMQQALVRHDELIEGLVVQHRGAVVRPRGEGDSRFAVFALASGAVATACAIQRAFHTESWPLPTPLRIRIGVHTGEAELIAADYYGTEVNRCARLRSLAHGGQTLVSEVTALLVRSSLPPGVSLRKLGEVRLKDITEAETVFQLDHPSLPRDFPPPSPSASSPNNLPAQPTRLVGREQEEHQVTQRLLESETRMLTLTGPGGTGKTRLALAVGEGVLDYFPQGVFFVDLTVLRESSAVVAAIFRAIGLRQIGGSAILEQLVEFLQDRTVLLILDNFEHVLQAGTHLGTVLQACPGVKLLVTSRQALHLAWERQQPVPPLSLPRPNQLGSVSELARVASIDLFVQRAQALDPSFALDADNCQDVATLCSRLDGLPLAIELAAGAATALPPAAILQHLQARAMGQADDPADAAKRHRSIGAAISWSYSRLDLREQRLFRRVGVFAGPFTYSAARDVCAGSDLPAETILDDLITLVDKNLLRSARRSANQPEFTMLETIREFAIDQLQRAGEMTGLRKRHADHYLVFAEEAATHLVDEQQTEWLVRLDRQYDNLRAVLVWAQTEPSALELGLRVAIALWRFWDIRSYLAEGRERLQSLLAPDSASPTLQAEALAAVGRLASLQGDSAVAIASCLKALDIVRSDRDARVMRVVLRDLGIAYYSAGQLDRAAELLDEGVSLARAAGDIGDEAVMLVFLGNAAHARGDDERAHMLISEGLRLRRAMHDRRGIALTLHALSVVAQARGDPEFATSLLNEALGLCTGLDERRGLAMVLSSLGDIARREGQVEDALHLQLESLIVRRQIGDRRGMPWCLVGAAAAALTWDRPREAARLLSAAAAMREATGTSAAPAAQHNFDQDVASARAQLGADEFAQAWAEGRRLSLDELVASVRALEATRSSHHAVA